MVERVTWLADHKSGLFYGSAFVKVNSIDAARAIVACASEKSGPGVRTKSRERQATSKKALKAAKKLMAEAEAKAKAVEGRSLAAEQEAAKEVAAATKAMEVAMGEEAGLRLGGRRLRVAFASATDGKDSVVEEERAAPERERPPVGA